MNPIDNTTYSADPVEHLQTVVGDEKQAEALPRVKIKGWDNEVNLSVGVIYDDTPHTMSLEGDKVIWQQGDVSASFYSINETPLTTESKISLINEGEISPQRIAAGYEVDRHFNWIDQTIRIHRSNEKAMMYYGFYDSDDFIDRSKLDIPEIRLSPTDWNDPNTLDNQLPLICVHYNAARDDLVKIQTSTITAIKEVLAGYGVKAYHVDPKYPYKLYFKDGVKDVKFFSTYYFGGYYYYYINLGHDYNGALDYYKGTPKPRNDQYAYGLRAIVDVPNSIIDEIITRYAELYGLPLVPRVFTPEEEAKITEIETTQNNDEWVLRGNRTDVYKLTADENNENGFEFDITLVTKPESNIYTLSIETKGLSFYKQKTIPREKRTTENQPPRVAGSYAVYHNSKQNNEYKAGKAFHIYRPIIKDATGWEVWGDIDIDTEMRITIPQDFIDNATYPIVIDPTFGYTTIGATIINFKDKILASQQTMGTVAGNLTSMTFYNSGILAGDGALQMALYSSTGAFISSSLAYSSLGGGGSWLSTLFSTNPLLTASANYRLALTGSGLIGGYGNSVDTRYDSTVGKTSYSLTKGYAADSYPAYMTSFTTENDLQYSFYATTGYQWPVMMGSSANLVATSTARYAPMYGGSSTTWTTTSAFSVISPSPAAYSNFRFDLTTAPGGVTAREMSVSGNIPATITGAAVTATNTTDVFNLIAGSLLAIGSAPTGTPAASAGSKWRLAVTSTSQPWYSTSISALSTTANRFMGVQDGKGLSTTGAAATSTMPSDSGTIRSVSCKIVGGTLGSGSYSITLVKNGSTTSMPTMTINNPTSYTTSGTTVSVVAGDTLYWQIVPATPDAGVWLAISCEYESTTPGRGIVFGGVSTAVSGTTYSSSFDAWDTTETLISARAVTHTIIALRASLSVAPGGVAGANTRTLTFRKNAANQTPAITITSTATSGTWSGSLAVDTDDLIDFRHTSTGAPATSNLFWSYVFTVPAISTSDTRLLAMTGVGK